LKVTHLNILICFNQLHNFHWKFTSTKFSQVAKLLFLCHSLCIILNFFSTLIWSFSNTSIMFNCGWNTHKWYTIYIALPQVHLSLYLLIWDFLFSQINIWTTTTCYTVSVVLPKPSWYEFLIGFLICTPTSKYLHLTTFSNIRVIVSMFLYL
jgi:hypothetical protein